MHYNLNKGTERVWTVGDKVFYLPKDTAELIKNISLLDEKKDLIKQWNFIIKEWIGPFNSEVPEFSEIQIQDFIKKIKE